MKSSKVSMASGSPETMPAQASDMPRGLVMLFATASGLSVANVYYAQPLLDALARDFDISQGAIGGVVTATHIGCALALLLLVPLGDRLDRRRLMAVQLFALLIALATVGMANSAHILAVGNAGCRFAGHGDDAGTYCLCGQRRRAA